MWTEFYYLCITAMKLHLYFSQKGNFNKAPSVLCLLVWFGLKCEILWKRYCCVMFYILMKAHRGCSQHVLWVSGREINAFRCLEFGLKHLGSMQMTTENKNRKMTHKPLQNISVRVTLIKHVSVCFHYNNTHIHIGL